MAGLVIFDCDGVLVDSERVANRILASLLSELGLPTTPEESVRDFMGRSMPSCVAAIETRLGAAVPPDFTVRYYESLFTAPLEAVPGASACVASVQEMGFETCVASSGSPERIRWALARTGLLPLFGDRLYSAEQVARGKPAPDLFLWVASSLGVPPADCIVVEDSPAGVSAAVAAGMTAFGYADLVVPEVLSPLGATVVTDLAALPGALSSWGSSGSSGQASR